jgi:hypothetical protein
LQRFFDDGKCSNGHRAESFEPLQISSRWPQGEAGDIGQRVHARHARKRLARRI